MEKLMNRKEAAEYLGISLKSLDDARRGGSIAYVRYSDNGRIYFTEAALQEYIARCTHSARPANQIQATYRKRRKPTW